MTLKSDIQYAYWESRRKPDHIKIDLGDEFRKRNNKVPYTDATFKAIIPDIVKQVKKIKVREHHSKKSCFTLLDCSLNHLSDPEIFKDLCERLDEIGCFIFHWRCHQNCLGDNFCEFLANYILTHTQCVHQLHLSHNFITQVGAIHLLHGVKNNAAYPLTSQRGKHTVYQPLYLRVEHNRIKAKGVTSKPFLDEIRSKIPTCGAQDPCTASKCTKPNAHEIKLHFHWAFSGSQKPEKTLCTAGKFPRKKQPTTKDLLFESINQYKSPEELARSGSTVSAAAARPRPAPLAAQAGHVISNEDGSWGAAAHSGADITSQSAFPSLQSAAAAKPKPKAKPVKKPQAMFDSSERPPEFKPSTKPSFNSCETAEVPATQPEPAMEPTQDEPLEAVFRKTQTQMSSNSIDEVDEMDAVLNSITSGLSNTNINSLSNTNLNTEPSDRRVNASQDLSQDSSAHQLIYPIYDRDGNLVRRSPTRPSPPGTAGASMGFSRESSYASPPQEPQLANTFVERHSSSSSSSDSDDADIRPPPPEAGGGGNAVIRPARKRRPLPKADTDSSDTDSGNVRRPPPEAGGHQPRRRSPRDERNGNRTGYANGYDDRERYECREPESYDRNRNDYRNDRSRDDRAPKESERNWNKVERTVVGERGFVLPSPTPEMVQLRKLMKKFGYKAGPYGAFFKSLKRADKLAFVLRLNKIAGYKFDARCFVKRQPQPDHTFVARCTSCLKEGAKFFVTRGLATNSAVCSECGYLAMLLDGSTQAREILDEPFLN